MTHRDRGHFAAKHPDRRIDPRVADQLRSRSADGTVSCSAAAEVGSDLGVPPATVGENADLLEIRLVECQLGLFGWAEGHGRGRLVNAAGQVSDQLEAAIREHLADGCLPCVAAWQVADELDLERRQVADACEALGIKVIRCQLGAF